MVFLIRLISRLHKDWKSTHLQPLKLVCWLCMHCLMILVKSCSEHQSFGIWIPTFPTWHCDVLLNKQFIVTHTNTKVRSTYPLQWLCFSEMLLPSICRKNSHTVRPAFYQWTPVLIPSICGLAVLYHAEKDTGTNLLSSCIIYTGSIRVGFFLYKSSHEDRQRHLTRESMLHILPMSDKAWTGQLKLALSNET